MNLNLKSKAVSATVWSAIDIFARQFVSFGITLVLVRILTPTDYGIVGLISIFLGFATVFINSGFTSALIQREKVTEIDLSSVFYFNICVALFFSILLGFGSPLIADFFKMPVLISLTRIMAVSTFIGAFGSVQNTLLIKSLNFRRQCVISLVSVVGSGTVAIILASHGYGVWSLAISHLIATFITTLLLWGLNSWRPKLIFSIESIRNLFKFGIYLLFSNLLDTLFSRINTLLIGKFYSPADLGYYTRADSAQQLPTGLLSGIISRVAFPIFAAAQKDKALLRVGLRKAITMSMMLNIPIMLGMAVTAPSLVFVVFGEQWLPCVPYLQILCLGGILWPLHVLNLNVLIAQGHSKLFFRLEVIKKIFGIAVIGSACFFGIITIAWGMVAISVVGFAINARYSGLFLNYGTVKQTMSLLPYLSAGLTMAVCTWLISIFPLYSITLLLTAQFFVGAFVYTIICHIFRLPAFYELIQLLKPYLHFINKPGLES